MLAASPIAVKPSMSFGPSFGRHVAFRPPKEGTPDQKHWGSLPDQEGACATRPFCTAAWWPSNVKFDVVFGLACDHSDRDLHPEKGSRCCLAGASEVI